jgi:hypothetical protein
VTKRGQTKQPVTPIDHVGWALRHLGEAEIHIRLASQADRDVHEELAGAGIEARQLVELLEKWQADLQ